MHKSVAAMSQQGRSSYVSYLALVVDDEPGVEMLSAPGTRRHIKDTLKAGATMEEILEVLKHCIVQRAQACNLSVPILAEEIAAVSEMVARP
jgi:alkylhydroperoxidase/carboxymuconolactone decarboxylase family protein YurZ